MTREQKELNLGLLNQVDAALSAATSYLAKNNPDYLVNIPDHLDDKETHATFFNPEAPESDEDIFEIIVRWTNPDLKLALPCYQLWLEQQFDEESENELRQVKTAFPNAPYVLPEVVLNKDGDLLEFINVYRVEADGAASVEVGVERFSKGVTPVHTAQPNMLERMSRHTINQLIKLDFNPEVGVFEAPFTGHDFEYLEYLVRGIKVGRYLPQQINFFGSQGLTRTRINV